MSCLFAMLEQGIGEKEGGEEEECNRNRGQGQAKKGKRRRTNPSTTTTYPGTSFKDITNEMRQKFF